VVLHTNVVVSGAFFGGAPRVVPDAWSDGRLHVVVTPRILDEYLRVCDRLRASYPDAGYRSMLTQLAAQGSLVPDSEGGEQIPADPDDDRFMRCAHAVGAFVVSGDRHLIAADGWKGVRVLTSSALLASLANQGLGATQRPGFKRRAPPPLSHRSRPPRQLHAPVMGPLLSKHLSKDAQRFGERRRFEPPKLLDEASTVGGAELIQDDEAILLLESARNAKWVGVPTGRHGCHKECGQVFVQLVR
jgi:predicted nucleic acid-binding protein